MDENDITKDLPMDKFKELYEYLKGECLRNNGILEKLKLSDLAEECLQTLNDKRADMKENDTEWKNKYTTLKLKTSIRIYESLNEELCKEIKVAEREIARNESLHKEFSVPENEIKILKEKIYRYEKQLKILNDKYPWLQEPQYNFDRISKQIKTLEELRNERDKLKSELDEYNGIKPDLNEANRQLKTIKSEYDTLLKEINKITRY